MREKIAELFKTSFPSLDTKVLQQKICRLVEANRSFDAELARAEKNLCNYCGKREQRDVYCSDECAEHALQEAAEHEYDKKLLHG